MTETILVIGGTGTVGTELIALLSESSSFKVKVLARDPKKAEESMKNKSKFVGHESPTQSHKKVEFVVGDISNESETKKALHGVQRVFLLTPSALGLNQCKTEAKIAHQAKDAGVKLLVKISVLGASISEPTSSLLFWHAQCEQEIIKSGVPFTFLRPNLFIQNNSRGDTVASIKNGALAKSGGDYKISHIDIRDISAVAAAILTGDVNVHNGRTYELTGPDSLSWSEVAKLFSEVIGKEVKPIALTDKQLFDGMKGATGEFVATFIIQLEQFYRTNKASTVNGNVEILTGKPARSFKNWIIDHKALFS